MKTRECVFGYGSLINMNQNFELNDHSVRQGYPVKIMNLSRKWNVHGVDQTFLGVDYDQGSWCNGILFCVSDNELNLLDRRERYYVRKHIEKTNIVFYNPDDERFLDQMHNIYFYETDPVYQCKAETHRISMEYVKICRDGCDTIGDVFKSDFIDTTKGWDNMMKYWYN